jgi:hypothetical protein
MNINKEISWRSKELSVFYSGSKRDLRMYGLDRNLEVQPCWTLNKTNVISKVSGWTTEALLLYYVAQ